MLNDVMFLVQVIVWGKEERGKFDEKDYIISILCFKNNNKKQEFKRSYSPNPLFIKI